MATFYIISLMIKKGYSKISRFFISVLWRASISTESFANTVNLGPHENRARETILNPNYNYEEFFSAAIMRLNYPSKINILPDKIKIDGINTYRLYAGSYKICIRCDKRKLPSKFLPIIACEKNDFLMLEGDLEKQAEFKDIFKAAKPCVLSQGDKIHSSGRSFMLRNSCKLTTCS